VEEEEEALVRLHRLEKIDPASEGAGDVGVVGIRGVGPLAETTGEAVAALNVSPFGVTGGAETGVQEDLRQGADLGREDGRGRKDAVLARIEPGEHRHVRRQRRRHLGKGVIEDRRPPGELVENGEVRFA
jgi:hypothetical protein